MKTETRVWVKDKGVGRRKARERRRERGECGMKVCVQERNYQIYKQEIRSK